MEFKTAYDMDGVLCENPASTEKTFFKMNGEERKKRKEYLLSHYPIAKQLHIPKEEEFIIITARKEKNGVKEISRAWVDKNLPGKKVQIFFLQEAKTYKNVIKFKAEIINKFNIQNFYEDNLVVLKGLTKLVKCSLFFYENGNFTPVASQKSSKISCAVDKTLQA